MKIVFSLLVLTAGLHAYGAERCFKEITNNGQPTNLFEISCETKEMSSKTDDGLTCRPSGFNCASNSDCCSGLCEFTGSPTPPQMVCY